MFCTNCGKEIDSKSKFCTNCGATVSNNGDGQSEVSQNYNSVQMNNQNSNFNSNYQNYNNYGNNVRPKSSSVGAWWVLIIVLIVAIFLFMVIGIGMSSEKKSTTSKSTSTSKSTTTNKSTSSSVNTNKSTTITNTNKNTNTTTKTNTAMIVNYKTLHSEYMANPIAADAKYRGKILQLTGPIYDIDREIMGEPYVTFYIDFLEDVRITFKKSEESKVTKLKKGQTITVKGKCTGTLLSTTVALDECEILY